MQKRRHIRIAGGLCFVLACLSGVALANDPLRATDSQHLPRGTQTDTGVRVTGMELSFINYHALLRDFPELKTLIPRQYANDVEYLQDAVWRAKVDTAVLDSFSFMSQRQLGLHGIRFTTSPQGAGFNPEETIHFHRPPGSNRASMIDFFGGLVNVKGNGNGGEDILRSGSDVASQVAEFQAIQKLPEGPKKQERLHALRTSDHRDGLMTRHEGLGMEVATMRALQMQFDIHNAKFATNFQTVEPYFLIEAPGSDNFFGARFSFVGRQASSDRYRMQNGSEQLYHDEHGGHQGTTSDAVIDAGGFKLKIDPKMYPQLAEAYFVPDLPLSEQETNRTYDAQMGNAWKNAAQNGEALATKPQSSRQLAAFYLDIEKLGPVPLDSAGNPDASQLSPEQKTAYLSHGLLDEGGRIRVDRLSAFQREWIAAKKELIQREKIARELAELKLSAPQVHKIRLAEEESRAARYFEENIRKGEPISEIAKRAHAAISLSHELLRPLLIKAMEEPQPDPQHRARLHGLILEELARKNAPDRQRPRHFAELLLSRMHPENVDFFLARLSAEDSEARQALSVVEHAAASGSLKWPPKVYEVLLKQSPKSKHIFLRSLAHGVRQDPEALRIFAGHTSSSSILNNLKLLELAVDKTGRVLPLDVAGIATIAENPHTHVQAEAARLLLQRILEARVDLLARRSNAPLNEDTKIAIATMHGLALGESPLKNGANHSLANYLRGLAGAKQDWEFVKTLETVADVTRRGPASSGCRPSYEAVTAL